MNVHALRVSPIPMNNSGCATEPGVKATWEQKVVNNLQCIHYFFEGYDSGDEWKGRPRMSRRKGVNEQKYERG